MQFDFEHLPALSRYNLLSSLVVPRPIAWVTTRSDNGAVNLAPYSFFNVMGHEPPLVALGILASPSKGLKDTLRNIEEQREFAVSLVTEPLLPAMNLSAGDLPYGVSEAELAEVTLAPGRLIDVPHVRNSNAALECRLLQSLAVSERQRVVLGEVVCMHVADELVLDAAQGFVNVARHAPVARMGGSALYCRSTDRFELERPDDARVR